MYPVMLDVENQPCLVVGGGGVALRKVQGLLVDGAKVTVVAIEPVGPLMELASTGTIVLEERPYLSPEAASYSLVFAATDDRDVNRRVFEDARRGNVWVNVADDPELCSFHLPARVRRGSFQLAIASAGEAPFAMRRLRQHLQHRFGEEWAEWLTAASRFRQTVRDRGLTGDQQEACFDAYFAATIDTDSLRARILSPEEERHLLATHGTP